MRRFMMGCAMISLFMGATCRAAAPCDAKVIFDSTMLKDNAFPEDMDGIVDDLALEPRLDYSQDQETELSWLGREGDDGTWNWHFSFPETVDTAGTRIALTLARYHKDSPIDFRLAIKSADKWHFLHLTEEIALTVGAVWTWHSRNTLQALPEDGSFTTVIYNLDEILRVPESFEGIAVNISDAEYVKDNANLRVGVRIAELRLERLSRRSVPKPIDFSALGFEEMPSLQIMAHRGAGPGSQGLAPENTIAAIKKGWELGAIPEVDVRASKDGQFVLFHDGTLDRTSNGTGNVCDFTLDELKKLDAGSWLRPEFAGEPIPALQEVFDLLMKEKDKKVFLHYKLPQLGEEFVQLIQQNQVVDQVIVCPDTYEGSVAFKRLDPSLETHIYAWFPEQLDHRMDLIRKDNYSKVDQVQIILRRDFTDYPRVSRAITELHDHGIMCWLFLWESSERERVLRCIEAGADGLVADFPDKMRMLLSSLSRFP